MIIYYLLSIIVSIFGVLFWIFPEVTISGIPIIGQPVSDILTVAVQYWNSFMETFPYAQTLWYVFLYMVIPFELGLLILKVFLGSRTPSAHH